MYPYVLSVLNQFLHLLRVLRGLLNSLGYALSATAGAAVMNINFSIQMMLMHIEIKKNKARHNIRIVNTARWP